MVASTLDELETAGMTASSCGMMATSTLAMKRHLVGRYLNGNTVMLHSSATVVDAKVRTASLHDRFALDIVVLHDGVVLDDDHVFGEEPGEVQIILLEDEVYTEETWIKALFQHATHGDVAIVHKALKRMNEQAQKQQYEQTVSGGKKMLPMIDVGSVAGSVLFDYLWVPSGSVGNDNEVPAHEINVDIIRALCVVSIDLNEIRADDMSDCGIMWTPLCYAIGRHLPTVAQVLIGYGANPWRTVYNAIEARNVRMVDLAILLGHLDVNDSYDGMVPLYAAAFVGDEDICTSLLNMNANVDLEVTGDDCEVHMSRSAGRIALHAAAAGGQNHICELLLQNGANVFHEDDDGCTALDVAEEPRVRALLKRHMRRRNRRSRR